MQQPVMRRPVPGTDLLLEVEKIIRDATWNGETPMPLAEVKRRMHQASPKHQQVRDLIGLLAYMGRVVESPRGVEFAYMPAEASERVGHNLL